MERESSLKSIILGHLLVQNWSFLGYHRRHPPACLTGFLESPLNRSDLAALEVASRWAPLQDRNGLEVAAGTGASDSAGPEAGEHSAERVTSQLEHQVAALLEYGFAVPGRFLGLRLNY